MTKKEKAIGKLTQLRDYYDQLDLDQDRENDEDPTNERDILDALNMAIQALEQEPCEDVSPTAIPLTVEEAKKLLYTEWKKEVQKDTANNRLLVAYNMAIKALEQEPCEDAISSEPRKIDEWDIKGKTAELWIVNGKLQIRYLGTIHNTDFHSVTPIRPKGEWIEHKRKNGTVIALTCPFCLKSPKRGERSDFCPHCGADMRGKNNEND